MARALDGWTLAIVVAAFAAQAVPGPGQSLAPAPPSPTSPAAQNGARLFRTYCSSCHGLSARGDGPVARYLRRPLPDLTRLAERSGGAFQADKIARIVDGRKPSKGHGGADMPVWGDAFQGSGDSESEAAVKARIKALVDYLESVQTK